MIDAGLLPFLAFTAILTYNKDISGGDGWGTLFGTPATAAKIIHASFLISVTNGGLHLVSLILSIYLAVIFRKISKLPPDMNPLEENLTARPHKRNRSELTLSEKPASRGTVDSGIEKRASGVADPLIPRTVPFVHTRMQSTETLGSYRPNRDSGISLQRNSMYQQSNRSFNYENIGLGQEKDVYLQNKNKSARNSRTDLDRLPPRPPTTSSRPSSARNSWVGPASSSLPNGSPDRPSSARNTWAGIPPVLSPGPSPSHPHTARNSAIGANLPLTSNASPMHPSPPRNNNFSTQSQNVSPTRRSPAAARSSFVDTATPPKVLQHQPAQSSNLATNWTTYSSPSPSPIPDNAENIVPSSPVSPLSSRDGTPERDITERKDWQPLQTRKADGKKYQSLAQHQPQESLYDFERDLKTPASAADKDLHPLGMNPPTPVNGNSVKDTLRIPFSDGAVETPPEPHRIALSDTPGNVPVRSTAKIRPSVGRPSSFVGSGGKARFYGDLRSSIGSIGYVDDKDKSDLISDTASQYSQGSYETLKAEDANTEPLKTDQKAMDGKGRVVSNTGFDLSGGYAGLGPEFGKGMGRRREVSGKVAEEGRTNWPLLDSDNLLKPPALKTSSPRAEGWARWKGM
ncbi:MAG: hypothetical protein Q9227_001603 [Pyrenula ochraceoflavens]